MKYDSALDQQSISGKIVSLILCVPKPCYVKSGHICDRICEKVRFSHIQFDPFLKFHNFLLILYNCLKFSMSVATASGCILILRAS